jgi:hypothetical protein
MTTILKKIESVLAVILLSSIMFIGVLVLAFQNGELKNQIENQNKILELTNNELYLEHVNDARIELSLDYLKKVNPKAYKQYEEFYNNETE